MSKNNSRRHYFHADASALGAVISKPSVMNFPVQSPLSLPPVGGHVTSHSANFQFERIISAASTFSEVEGLYETEGPRTTSLSVVKHLNVLDRVKIREIVGHLQAEHPNPNDRNLPEEYAPRVSFGGTRISPVQIDDSVLEISLDLDLLGGMNGKGYPKCVHLRDRRLWKRVEEQYNEKAGHLHCTLVKEIKPLKGELPKRVEGTRNGFQIEGFGIFFFAELSVQYHSYRLTMMRFELGCPTQGGVSVSNNVVNGDPGGG
jgi:hypothetical protein